MLPVLSMSSVAFRFRGQQLLWRTLLLVLFAASLAWGLEILGKPETFVSTLQPQVVAGHWVVTYSAPSAYWTSDGPRGEASGPYPSPHNTCTVGAGGGSSPWAAIPGTCSLDGDIITHVRWDGGSQHEPRPAAIIVTEISTATWIGDSGLALSGLPDEELEPGYARGTRKTVVAVNEDEFNLPMRGSPYSYAAKESTSTIAAGATISYEVGITNVSFGVTNTLQSSTGPECLIGQGHLGGISAPTYNFTEHQWAVAGNVFKSYIISEDHTSATLTLQDPADWQVPNPHWFWKEQGTFTVSCTARVWFGDKDLGTVTVHQSVKVWEPWNGFAPHLVTDELFFAGGQLGTSVPSKVVSYDPNFFDDDTGNAIEFYGAVGTPNRFRSPGTGGAGFHCYVQLALIDDLITFSGGPFWSAITTDGRWDLDNDFPYPASLLGFWPATSSESSDEANPLVAEDAPMLGLPMPATSFVFDDEYDMYQLYLPPGEDSAWVPLSHIYWTCYGTYASPWLLSGQPVPKSYIRVEKSERTNKHPVWTHIFTNS